MRTQLRLATLAALLVPALAFACGGATAGGGGSSSSGDGGKGSGTGSSSSSITESCNLVRLVPPVLNITNAATGAAVCNAVLVNNDAGSVNLSSCSGMEGCTGTCPYTVNSFASDGTPFSATISAPGLIPVTVPNLTVHTCGCSGDCAGPQEVAVQLQESSDSQEGVPLPDAGPGPCDGATLNASCSRLNFYCESGDGATEPFCDTSLLQCNGTTWIAPTEPTCPEQGVCPAYADATGSCSANGTACGYPQGTCLCTDDPGGLPIENGPVWSCTPTTAGCPGPRPNLGTPCSVPASLSCDYGQCSGGVAESCQGGYWQLSTDNVCPA